MIDTQRIVLLIAEKVREVATRQGNVPFLTGDLRKSIIVQLQGKDTAVVGSNLPYARAVHDGRPAITIRPKKKKALYWNGAKHPVKKVNQPARKGKPFLTDALKEVTQDFGFLEPELGKEVAKEIQEAIRKANL